MGCANKGKRAIEINRPSADNQLFFSVLILVQVRFFTGLIIKINGLKNKLNFSLILIIY